jgi:GTP cyclohydrolase IA
MQKIILTNTDVLALAKTTAQNIDRYVRLHDKTALENRIVNIYGIPRGGIPTAYAILPFVDNGYVTDILAQAHVVVDDIVDSGATIQRYQNIPGKAPSPAYIALINKQHDIKPLPTFPDNWRDCWIVFPWEETAEKGIEDHITRLLQFVGEDVTRGGLLETPARVAKAWQHWTKGYSQNAAEILKTFEDGAEKHDQMITVKDIPFYSHCEHHMAPFFGTADVAYIPNGKIVGLSKLSRLVGVFAHRLQVQERLTDQIADALMEGLSPLGVGVTVRARHLCMESRGVCQQGHHTVTTALRGAIKTNTVARQEFLNTK